MEGNKIAVLGEMLELGKYEERGHAMVGIRAASVCDELVAVGNRSKMIVEVSHKCQNAKKSDYMVRDRRRNHRLSFYQKYSKTMSF